MASYRFLILGEHNESVGLNIQTCEDDSAARDAAQKLSRNNSVEIWDGTRLVAHLYPGHQEQGLLQL
jgi:hypothetical protein